MKIGELVGYLNGQVRGLSRTNLVYVGEKCGLEGFTFSRLMLWSDKKRLKSNVNDQFQERRKEPAVRGCG